MKYLITLILTTKLLFGLNQDQIRNMKIAYKVGKTIKAKDGTTFENTLASIMGAESSWGEEVIGDKYDKNGRLKSVYESSLGGFQIKLSTAKLTIRKYPHLMKKYGYLVYKGKSIYLKYETNKQKMNYYKGILTSSKWKERFNKGQEKAKKTMAWANRNYIKHMKIHNSLVSKARKDTKLINKLFTDVRFGAEIAGHYLLSHYNHVLKKGWSRPYKRAVGRYNGGWNNMEYANRVLKRMKTVKKIMRKS
jgi:hypothetical protein